MFYLIWYVSGPPPVQMDVQLAWPITTVYLTLGVSYMMTNNFELCTKQAFALYAKYMMTMFPSRWGRYSEHKPSLVKMSTIEAFLKTAKMADDLSVEDLFTSNSKTFSDIDATITVYLCTL